MAKRSKSNGRSQSSGAQDGARSVPIARVGIRNGAQFAELMSGLMSDLIEGKVSPQIANATCNAGGKLLKVVEMQFKYGQPHATARNRRVLMLG